MNRFDSVRQIIQKSEKKEIVKILKMVSVFMLIFIGVWELKLILRTCGAALKLTLLKMKFSKLFEQNVFM